MIVGPKRVRVFARNKPTDLRKSYDTLSAIVKGELAQELLDGDLFLFLNKARNRCKVLLFDGTGLCIYQKRLTQGRFAAPWECTQDGQIIMSKSELDLFLEGSQLVFVTKLSPPQDLVAQKVATKPMTVR